MPSPLRTSDQGRSTGAPDALAAAGNVWRGFALLAGVLLLAGGAIVWHVDAMQARLRESIVASAAVADRRQTQDALRDVERELEEVSRDLRGAAAVAIVLVGIGILIATITGRSAVHSVEASSRRAREHEERLRHALDAGKLGDWELDLATFALESSVRCKAHFGRGPDEPFTYDAFLAALHPEDRPRVEAMMNGAVRTAGDYEAEYRCVWPDGSVRVISASGRALPGGRDAPGRFVGVTLDVTERRRAEQAVRDSEERLRVSTERLHVALDVGRIGAWCLDLETGEFLLSPTDFTLLGRDPSLPRPDASTWERHIHPADVDRVSATWRSALVERADFDLEFRIVRPDGEARWIRARGRVLHDDAGRPLVAVGAFVDVTEMKRASEAEARLAAHAENSPLAIVEWDPDYRIVRWSGEAQRLFGWTAAEVLGKRIHDLRLVHRDDVPRVEDLMRHLDDGRSVRNVSFNRNCRKDGTVIHCAWYNSALVDADGRKVSVYSQVLDRTHEVEASLALEAAAERHRTLVSVITDVPWTADAVGACVHEQPAWAAYSGQTWEEYRGFGWVAALHPDDRDRLLATWHRAVATRTIHEARTRLWQASTREYRHVVVRAAPVITPDGTVREWVGACTDVHEQTLAQDALKDADRRKDEFLAMLAHELRNPLAPIRNAVQVMSDLGPRDVRFERARDVVLRQAVHMSRLVDDLLDVSRITRGKVRLAKEPLCVRELVDAAVDASRPDVDREAHALAVDVPDDLWVEGDRARLVQVITNLVANAVKFTPRAGRIALHAARAGDRVTVAVRDSGVGIAREAQARIFDLFQQEDVRIDRRQGGLGIGLTLVKRLVELHGGTVSVASEGPGAGAEFTVTLRALPEAPAAVRPEHPAGSAGRPLDVVVVEDDEDAAESFRMLLELRGHAVHVAGDGIEAVRLLDALEPDVAFVDLGIPGMDGFAVARHVRRRATGRPLLVAVSGYGREEDKRRAREAGFDEHLTKPVDPALLETLLTRAGSAQAPPERVATLQ